MQYYIVRGYRKLQQLFEALLCEPVNTVIVLDRDVIKRTNV